MAILLCRPELAFSVCADDDTAQKEELELMGPRAKHILLAVVLTVWAANFLAPLVWHDFDPVAELNVVLMTVVGLILQIKPPKPPEGGSKE